ncbi:MAG TPA: hypothetical protein V6C91_13650 [Coleofasciculaceae cyanobacterium]
MTSYKLRRFNESKATFKLSLPTLKRSRPTLLLMVFPTTQQYVNLQLLSLDY